MDYYEEFLAHQEEAETYEEWLEFRLAEAEAGHKAALRVYVDLEKKYQSLLRQQLHPDA